MTDCKCAEISLKNNSGFKPHPGHFFGHSKNQLLVVDLQKQNGLIAVIVVAATRAQLRRCFH